MNTPIREQSDAKIPIGIPTGNVKRSAKTPSPRHQKSAKGTTERKKSTQNIQAFESDEKPTLFQFNILNSQQKLLSPNQGGGQSNPFNMNPELSLSKAFNSNEVRNAEKGDIAHEKLEEKYLRSLASN